MSFDSKVELRWVNGSVPAPEYGPDVARKVRVLQYRQRIDVARWTEWSTVPVVDGIDIGMIEDREFPGVRD